jgi:hypothetical protein
MADSIKVELKEKDLTSWEGTLKELKDFKKDFEGKLIEAKSKKTLEEAKVLFPDTTFFYDAKDRVLQIWNITMQAQSPEQWNEWMSKMAGDIASMNVELAGLELHMKAEQDKVVQSDKEKEKKISDEVNPANEKLIAMLQKIVDDQKCSRVIKWWCCKIIWTYT